jgi:chemotaxis protein MotA
MIVIVGCIVVFGAVLTGFTMAGGHVGALIQISELVTIGGAAIGALIVMSSKKILVDLLKGIVLCVKGSPFNKKTYEELFKLLYELFRLARRDGLMGLESHISSPEESSIFSKYPRVLKNHHLTSFIAGALVPVIEGTVKPEKLSELLETEIKVLEEEHHAPLGVLSKTADALPGFGIVAAVLGIVITMGAIDGPAEEIGEKVGAALVGTFLGILLSYGLFGPLAVRLEFVGGMELACLRSVAAMVQAFVNDLPPKVALEQGRRSVASELRPSRERLDELFAEADSG